jgi:glyoxylase-like metal-dependent hydrolase (beta-lactamase superfamily II)
VSCHRGIFRIPDQLGGYEWRPTVDYTPVRGRVWTAAEGVYRTIFLEGDEGVVAFDTFYSPGSANAYRDAIGRLFPHKPVHTIVYSHDHLDHCGFALDLAPEARVIAHEEAAAVIEARESDGQAPADETWSGERSEFDIDGVSFSLVNPGPTHGTGNVAAHFPQWGVLFMVDTVIPGVGYTFLPDWHLSMYVESMERLLALDDWDVFVPGHFWPVDRQGCQANLDYYREMADHAQTALAEGVDPDDIGEVGAYARERLAERYSSLFRYDEYIATNLMRFMVHLRTGGWGLEDNR